MKLSLLLTLSLPIAIYAQDSIAVSGDEYPNTFTSGSKEVHKFDNSQRRFNDWSISVGGGGAFMQSADLVSIHKNRIDWGWTAYVSLDKQISHVFGLSLQYQQGKTNQSADLNPAWGRGKAWTEFHQVNLIGDVNFSNLLRRVDNHSPYRWAIHGYAGIGFMGYNTRLADNSTRWNNPLEIEQKMDIASFVYQGGAGVKYKISRRVDLDARIMYVITGDDEFDGGGWENDMIPGGTRESEYPYNFIKKNNSDNFVTATLGLSFKLGKHISHLAWHDPLQEVYYKANLLEIIPADFVVCEKGDGDNDGVCDDWDRELNTPAGARVDGAGVALDMDLDGVIDLYDKCVTVPGPIENNGCPIAPVNNAASIEVINKNFEGIEFALNSDVIRPQSFEKLDHAADIIKTLDSKDQYLVIGATDTRGSAAYNQTLSQKRANAVVKYLNNKGVATGMLVAEGRGKNDLKYPGCDPATKCPEWKNEANRRVYFQQK
ncbi:MAG: OmpA family protein [Cruoricaptor ignavus]|nr:OmpA family protein [Cruoricaptor ignavus]